jgi:hypothetical protein
MSVDTTSIWLIGIIFSVLLAIAGFFFRSLVVKLDKGNETLMHIDKQLAVYEVKLDGYGTRIVTLEKHVEKNNNEIAFLKTLNNNIEQ